MESDPDKVKEKYEKYKKQVERYREEIAERQTIIQGLTRQKQAHLGVESSKNNEFSDNDITHSKIRQC